MMDQVFVFGSFSEDEAIKNAAPPPKPQPAAPVKAAPKPSTPRATSNGLKPNGHVERPPRSLPAAAVVSSPRSVEASPKSGSSGVQPAPEAEKSWAALVKVQPDGPRHPRKALVRQAEAIEAKESSIKPGSSSFPPRGLVNTGNTCFLNSTLQALLSCPPFCELLRSLSAEALAQDKYPLLHAFAKFAVEMENEESPLMEKYYRKGEDEGKTTQGMKCQPLTPSMFDPILLNFSPKQEPSTKGRQEDAQEFLGYLMNQMHDELIKLGGREKNTPLSVEDEGEWETVGPKNRTSITRTYSFIASPLSEIFGGQQDSFVKAKGAKTSATSEPFYLLHLDISSDFVHSVEEALKCYVAPTTVEYRSATGKTEDASKTMKLSSLPRVLILHLKRFSYGANGTWKLQKSIRFPPQLTLGRELLKENFEDRTYELVATITHHGKEPSGGHYTADTKLPDNTWARFDDRSVTAVGVNRVLHDQAYVLFYKRLR